MLRLLPLFAFAVIAVGCSSAQRQDAVPSPTEVPRLTPTPVSEAAWSQLASRPLTLVSMGADGACPTSEPKGDPFDPQYPKSVMGDGPIYAILGRRLDPRSWGRQEGGWYYTKVLWISLATYQGPAVIRGRQIDGTHQLRFEDGPTPAFELRFPAGFTGAQGHDPRQWRDLPSYLRFEAAGCYALQVDGLDFRYTIVFEIAS
jgi:hypothetical protein